MNSICQRAGCNKPVWVDPSTQIQHNFCGRTHATDTVGHQLKDPHGPCHICSLEGCEEPIFYDKKSDRVHDFCSQDHARLAMDRNEWQKPMKKQKMPSSTPSNVPTCLLNTCSLPCCLNPSSGEYYDYCGRTHAKKGRDKKAASLISATAKALPPQISKPIIPTFNPAQWAPSNSSSSSSSSSSSYNSSSSSSSSVPAPAPLSNKATATAAAPKAPPKKSRIMCVVCQKYNADFVCVPCGHICLCEEDSKLWKIREQQRLLANQGGGGGGAGSINCPVCQQPADNICKVYGL
jgi:hypothetical protein